MSRRTAILTVLLSLATASLAYMAFHSLVLSVQTSFANEQTEIYYEMLENSRDAEPEDIVGYLDYTVGYYPSGTKQTAGSALDRTVERVRADVVARIIAILRERTGEDLGDDPKDWIEAWKEPREPKPNFRLPGVLNNGN